MSWIINCGKGSESRNEWELNKSGKEQKSLSRLLYICALYVYTLYTYVLIKYYTHIYIISHLYQEVGSESLKLGPRKATETHLYWKCQDCRMTTHWPVAIVKWNQALWQTGECICLRINTHTRTHVHMNIYKHAYMHIYVLFKYFN